MSGRYYYYGRNRGNRWNRGGRYYGNRRYRSTTRSKAWGNMRAAKQQADQSTFTINIPSTISAFCSNAELVPGTGQKSLGCFALSIFDQLRKSEFFNNYANMYDEFKIDKVKVKLLPTSWSNLGQNDMYRNLTVYTAWDRSGLNETQYDILVGRDFRTANDLPGWVGTNVWVIGSENGETFTPEGGSPTTDFGGLYVTIGKDITTYSSAESRVVNVNTNTSIVRWLNPKTMQEKSQWVSTASLKPWYASYDMIRGRYYDLPVTDIKQLRLEEDYNAQEIVGDTGFQAKTISREAISGLSSDNPCSLLEDNGIRFKPILLVSVYPEDNNVKKWPIPNNNTIDVPANLMQFNIETEVVCSFRGLRKSKVVAAIENENKNNNEYPGLKLPIDYYFELNDVDITNKDNDWDPIKKEFSTDFTITSLPDGDGYDVVDVDRDELAYQPEIKLEGYCNPQNDIDNNLWVTLESPYLTKKITQKFPLLPGYSTQPINENGKRAISENEINITSNGTYILGQNDQDPDDLEIDLSTTTENLKTLTLSEENNINKNTNTNTNVNTFTLGKFKIDINTSTVPVILNENSQEILTIEQYNQINNTNFIGFNSIDISSLLKMAINIPEYDFNKFLFYSKWYVWDGGNPTDIAQNNGEIVDDYKLYIFEINESTIAINYAVPPIGSYYVKTQTDQGGVEYLNGVLYDGKILQNVMVAYRANNMIIRNPLYLFGKLINKPEAM